MNKIEALNELLNCCEVRTNPKNNEIVEMISKKNENFGVYIQKKVFRNMKDINELIEKVHFPHTMGLVPPFENELKSELLAKEKKINKILNSLDEADYKINWQKDNMKIISARFPNEIKEQFADACDKLGVSQRSVLEKAILETIEKAKKNS